MPIVAVVDTNCDPDVITYVIPGNDDAIRSGALMCRVLAEAVIEGRWVAEHQRAVAPPAAATPAGRGQLRRAGAGTSGTLDPTPPGSPEAIAAATAPRRPGEPAADAGAAAETGPPAANGAPKATEAAAPATAPAPVETVPPAPVTASAAASSHPRPPRQ